MKVLTVVQHTSADYLGLMEDHLEGRKIRFNYVRPFTETGKVPRVDAIRDGLILMGGGPWGSAGTRDVPTLAEEIALVRGCLMLDKPILAFGLGAQILAIAAHGKSAAAPLEFRAGYATRVKDGALNGFLPERFPNITYMRDFPVPPAYAEVLAEDEDGRPALFQIGEKVFGFAGNIGFKLAMAEDLIMEFEESPPDTGPTLQKAAAMKTEVEDALIPIMTGLIQLTGWMQAREN